MASLRELFKAGYTFDRISYDPKPTPEGPTLHLTRSFRFEKENEFSMEPDEVIAVDLEEYLSHMLYGVTVYNNEYHVSAATGETTRIIVGETEARGVLNCAVIKTVGRGKLLQATLPLDSLSLYPNVGVEPVEQQLRLLEDYSQPFKRTVQAIAAGRHLRTRG